MSTYREIAPGHEHNELHETATRLERDGYQKLADDYYRRSNEAEKVFVHLRQIAKLFGRTNRSEIAEDGAVAVDELIRLGWTPPAFLSTGEVDR